MAIKDITLNIHIKQATTFRNTKLIVIRIVLYSFRIDAVDRVP